MRERGILPTKKKIIIKILIYFHMVFLILTRNYCGKVRGNQNIIFQFTVCTVCRLCGHLFPLYFIGHPVLEIFSTLLKVSTYLTEVLVFPSNFHSAFIGTQKQVLSLIIFKAFSKSTNPTISTKYVKVVLINVCGVKETS